jgi:DNA-binding NarL/FixJ family response regulator
MAEDYSTPGLSRVVLLVGGDLMATARLERAARDTGAELRVTSPENFIDALRADRPDIVILDLDRGRAPVLESLAEARAQGVSPGRVVGYFSHVDGSLRARAQAAGCRALPRGRFWGHLTEELAAPGSQA